MKPTKKIIGLRIISISDGTQVGVVKDFVLNPQGKTLDFIIVDQPTDYFGAKVIAFPDILGFGEFALTIPHPDVVQDVAQNSEVQNLLKLNTRVIGTKVLTKKGQLIGEVKEILIDEETGQIAACLFESDGKMLEVIAGQIITLGKELLIVEDIPTFPLDLSEGLSVEEQMQTTEATNLTDDLDLHESNPSEEMKLPAEVDTKAILESTIEPETSFNLFEQRQIQYFIGKKVEKDIVLDNSQVLSAGEIITPEIVTHVTTRSTLMEVTSHLQKN